MDSTAMQVIEITAPGGPEMLRPATRPRPIAGPGEVLIKAAAAGVNGADLAQRRGKYAVPPGASDLLGLEAAGVVVGLGAGIEGFALGDRVCALTNGGAYAQFCVAPAGQVLKLPDNLTLVEGAALIETIATVWTNVFEDARLVAGETLLVHGGSSGIGTTAIQMARLAGCTVYTTVGSAAKAQACLALGAKRAINYREEDFAAVVKAETGRGVDVILDVVGGSYLEANLRALARRGRLAIISLQGGRSGELDIGRLMMNALQVTGSTLRPRMAEEKARIVAAVHRAIWPAIADGRFKPVIDSVFPLELADTAHRKMESSTHIGKVVLEID